MEIRTYKKVLTNDEKIRSLHLTTRKSGGEPISLSNEGCPDGAHAGQSSIHTWHNWFLITFLLDQLAHGEEADVLGNRQWNWKFGWDYSQSYPKEDWLSESGARWFINWTFLPALQRLWTLRLTLLRGCSSTSGSEREWYHYQWFTGRFLSRRQYRLSYEVASPDEHTYAHHLLMEQSLKYLKPEVMLYFWRRMTSWPALSSSAEKWLPARLSLLRW